MAAITIVDYGVGNIASIANMLKKAGHTGVLSGDPAEISAAEKLILPGVGSFDHAAARLRDTGLGELVKERALAGVPVLGVCLGMQLLLDGSEEGDLPGLGLIPGLAKRFPSTVNGEKLRVPHMGWNTVQRTEHGINRLAKVASGDRFYFVHSYFAEVQDPAHSIGTTQHGIEFSSMIHHGSATGVQFHPEKSHRYGMRLLVSAVEETA